MATASDPSGPSSSSGNPTTPGTNGLPESGGASVKKSVATAKAASAPKGRFTPKKDAKGKVAGPEEKRPGYQASGRYTAPTVHTAAELHETKPWVPYLMFAFLIVGLVMIIGNYLEILPGASDGKYLLGGLLSITGGFATATQLR